MEWSRILLLLSLHLLNACAEVNPADLSHHYNNFVRYDYKYGVEDKYSGARFGHEELREGMLTKGQYFVYLPDGRIQTVRYYADEFGYHPTVTYNGPNGEVLRGLEVNRPSISGGSRLMDSDHFKDPLRSYKLKEIQDKNHSKDPPGKFSKTRKPILNPQYEKPTIHPNPPYLPPNPSIFISSSKPLKPASISTLQPNYKKSEVRTYTTPTNHPNPTFESTNNYFPETRKPFHNPGIFPAKYDPKPSFPGKPHKMVNVRTYELNAQTQSYLPARKNERKPTIEFTPNNKPKPIYTKQKNMKSLISENPNRNRYKIPTFNPKFIQTEVVAQKPEIYRTHTKQKTLGNSKHFKSKVQLTKPPTYPIFSDAPRKSVRPNSYANNPVTSAPFGTQHKTPPNHDSIYTVPERPQIPDITPAKYPHNPDSRQPDHVTMSHFIVSTTSAPAYIQSEVIDKDITYPPKSSSYFSPATTVHDKYSPVTTPSPQYKKPSSKIPSSKYGNKIESTKFKTKAPSKHTYYTPNAQREYSPHNQSPPSNFPSYPPTVLPYQQVTPIPSSSLNKPHDAHQTNPFSISHLNSPGTGHILDDLDASVVPRVVAVPIPIEYKNTIPDQSVLDRRTKSKSLQQKSRRPVIFLDNDHDNEDDYNDEDYI